MEFLVDLVYWFVSSFSSIWNTIASWSWLGSSLIGLMVFRRVVRVMRKVY